MAKHMEGKNIWITKAKKEALWNKVFEGCKMKDRLQAETKYES